MMAGTHKGDYTFAAPTNLRGTVTGNAVVTSGTAILVHGTCGGDLVIEQGGSAEIFGSVAGTVTIRSGGRAVIHGTIGALVDPDNSAVVQPTAKIG